MIEEPGIKQLMEAFDDPNDILEWINSLDTFIAKFDKDGILLFCNETPLIAGGLTYEDVLGKYFPDTRWWSHSQTERMRVSECIEKGKKGITSRIETNFRRAEGKPAQVIFNLRPIFNEDGDIKYLAAEGKVIDEEHRLRKELEKMKFELEDRVAQRTNELEKANKSLLQAQKMEAIGRLAGGIAHDFNNMLNVILGCAELIMLKIPADNSKNSIYSMMKQIEKAVNHSADLTRQLLGFSRMQVIRPRAIEVNSTLAGIEKMISRLIGEDISIHFILRENLWNVYLDPLQIDQLTLNLALNARDAMPKGGNLVIETANMTIDDVFCSQYPELPRGEFVMISISDNGTGIDQETLPHIFEPFYTTKIIGEGTGMGLATVYGIVKQNNGFINVYSEPGEGTTFKIYFPRWTESEEKEEILPAKSVVSKTGTILLVEDDEMVMETIKRILEVIGHKVIVFSSPNKALAFCKEEKIEIHILLTDLVMPEMSGKDLMDAIETIKPDIQTIFMSGYTADIVAHRGVLEKNVNLINKPFTKDQLADKVQEVLGNIKRGIRE